MLTDAELCSLFLALFRHSLTLQRLPCFSRVLLYRNKRVGRAAALRNLPLRPPVHQLGAGLLSPFDAGLVEYAPRGYCESAERR